MYIAVLVILSILAILFILIPYFKADPEVHDVPPDIGVYKAQLAELSNDLERGIIDEEEAGRTKVEIERRILKAADSSNASSELGKPNTALAVALVTIVLFSAAFYTVIGSPGMPDFPIEDQKEGQLSPERAAAFAQADDLIGKVKARLATNPEETQGWAYLANLEMSKGEFQKAAVALYRAHLLAPDEFDYQLMYAESLIMASGERVTPAALVILNKIHKVDPDHSGPRYYLGLAEFQAGNVEIAYEEWQNIRIGLSDSDPLLPLLDIWIGRAEVTLGLREELPQTRAPSISQEQAEAIQGMSEGEQQELIRQMVSQLATKQEDNPGNIEGWIRLSRAYMMLGQKQDAVAAMQAAVKNAPEAQKAALQKEVEKLEKIE
ncbi:MAG: c-type cytochrome biogenesis protein CcmI [Emcibacteraceae bacterium]|nr:c-type cytochrome biogenesis protein CcmI [Emcibacteraceae bacterium]MDG1995003.1 c-type cytochrome biogenesis protein CcmI [Emcibacteraceae bacterium]